MTNRQQNNNSNNNNKRQDTMLKDFGPNPFIINIDRAAMRNGNYRTALWTGKHLQVTLMSIPPNGDIGLEIHPDTDQFIKIEEGTGVAFMGNSPERMNLKSRIGAGDAVFVPAGTWHNIVNIGSRPLKIYTVYAPPHHPHGTVQRTKADAEKH